MAPQFGADLFPLHAPGVYDFRERDGTKFAYLSDSDNVKRPFCGRWLDNATGLRQMIEDNPASGPDEARMAAGWP